MAIVVDESWTKLPVSSLKANDVIAVSMYVGQDTTGKNMNAATVDIYGAAGIKTITNFEFLATEVAGGFDRGKSDALLGLAQATACKMPNWAPIIFSVDENVSAASAIPYFQGVASVLGIKRIGVYGDYDIVHAIVSGGYAAYAWQTIAWSDGAIDTGQIQLYQNGQTIGAADVDLIESSIDQIAWLPGQAAPIQHWNVIPVSITVPTLNENAASNYVELMQSLLNVHGGTEALIVDGDFGPSTLDRLKEYQGNNGLTVDGICGPDTWKSLLA
jgi:peptidoglycan hydrolase-like protein with peptidoglycan-binding domain